MRTAKYHDYIILKVILFIALVCLGLFLYMTLVDASHEHVSEEWIVSKTPTCTTEGLRHKVCEDCGEKFGEEVMPFQHKPGEAVKENQQDHHPTKGESSYESAVYCTLCDALISREVVKTEFAGDVTVKYEKVTPATCTEDGSRQVVKYCTCCGDEVSRQNEVLPATGHDYVWTAEYKDGEYVLNGECDIDDHKVTLTENGSLTFDIKKDETVQPCCVERYYISFAFEGKDFEVVYDSLPTEYHVACYGHNLDSFAEAEPIYFDIVISYDAELNRRYFDVTSIDFKLIESNLIKEWDEYGFCYAMFVCVDCEENKCSYCAETYGHILFVYSAERDTRITQ